jgi:hypothetical protein
VSGADQEFAFQGTVAALYIKEYNAVGKHARFVPPVVSLSSGNVRASTAALIGRST